MLNFCVRDGNRCVHFAIATRPFLWKLDKILVKHRTGVNTSIENTREKSWDNFYYALKKLKHFIQEKNLYIRFHQDFINYVVSFSLWQLNTLKGNSFYILYQNLKNKWLKEFDVTKYEKSFFYNNNNYKRINYILQSDLVKINYNNRILKKLKKFFCPNNHIFNILYYKYLKN